MNEIILVDYIGICDENGTVVGHSVKAFTEYVELLKGKYEVSGMFPQCMADAIDKKEIKKYDILKYNIISTENYSIIRRIGDKFKELANIHQVFQMVQGKNNVVLWFYRLDFFLFLYLFFMRKFSGKVLCLLFQQDFAIGKFGRILNYIYKKALKDKVDGVLYTSPHFEINHRKKCYIPDYCYDKNKYGKYLSGSREDKVVCLGTMGYQKNLEELVEIFNRLKYPLEIAGRFYQSKRFEQLKKAAGKNISVRNEIIPEDEYYLKIASAKYVVLPYDMQLYKDRTSGVLLESIFLGTVPIAPENILKSNFIPGIGYENMRELDIDDWQKKYETICKEMKQLVERKYDKNGIREKLCSFITEVCRI